MRVFDRHVSVAKLVGANRRYIEREIPHIAEILSPQADALVRWADVLVVGNGGEEHLAAARRFLAGGEGTGPKRERRVVDLVRAEPRDGSGSLRDVDGYRGIAW